MAENDWYLLITEWEQSELTQRQFCSKRNIKYADFKHWRTKGLLQGIFASCSKSNSDNSKSSTELLNFTRLDRQVSHSREADGKYIEVCLPYGITLKLPV